MDLQLAGKRVLITGASKGIGLACAIAFAREGAEPVLVARDDAALHGATAAIREQTGRQAGAVTLDLAQPGAAERLCKETGPVDILVNNAGAVPGG
ncbi:SDR family NAD(P)-dependent oxidoreductase, partial [Achromobacter sp.]